MAIFLIVDYNNRMGKRSMLTRRFETPENVKAKGALINEIN